MFFFLTAIDIAYKKYVENKIQLIIIRVDEVPASIQVLSLTICMFYISKNILLTKL